MKALVVINTTNYSEANTPGTLYLKPVNGNPKFFEGGLPKKARLMHPTIANSLGIKENKTYLVQIELKEVNEWGPQFNYTNLGEASFKDLMELGNSKADFSELDAAINKAQAAYDGVDVATAVPVEEDDKY